jgi:hypothetical protein
MVLQQRQRPPTTPPVSDVGSDLVTVWPSFSYVLLWCRKSWSLTPSFRAWSFAFSVGLLWR